MLLQQSADTTSIKDRLREGELLLLVPVYIVFSFINLRIRLLFAKVWFDRTLARNHEELLRFNYANNDQSRLLQFYIPEFFHRILGIPIEDAYALQRWLFISLAFVFFHAYLRKWFSPQTCFASVAFLAAILPLSYYNDLQESLPLLLITFLLGLWAIRDNRTILLIAMLFVGGFTNETMVLLPLVYFFFHLKVFDVLSLALNLRNTFLVSLCLWL